MKFAAVVIALTAATIAVAGPVAFEAREESSAVELNDIDTAAIDYLVRRGLFDASALEARGLFGSGTDLQITFSDPSGSISAGRKKEATKALQKAVSKADQKKFPFCDVVFGNGGLATYRCFSSSQKKIGQQGPAGAFKI
ncbi:hypothetical protein GSI_15436 [Ganoderma sinense ZZ0214-1]|uniref:Transporter n=1 Tax=Ganoderma sinense ZZ0214-1 TaxID=1077348 RepID=A0A2G8RMK6_9APHY|nr:hypothetical protein GSI_15436 [Ganoderma sinense ZZ0214-1]